MDKKDLINTISRVLIPYGFKKKGSFWTTRNDEITKMVNIQKSEFSDRYYLNYGYLINSIPLENEMMHIFNGFGSPDFDENKRIKELMDIGNDISDEDRIGDLERMLVNRLISRFQAVNTEKELLEELKKRPHLNDLPLHVKRYFRIA